MMMWGNKKNVTYMVVLFGVFVEIVKSKSVHYNGQEKGLLCQVYTAARHVLTHAVEPHKRELEEAIYGPKDRAHFTADGEVNLKWKCSNAPRGRGGLCTYFNVDGCFAESLYGTFMCLCTPGVRTESGKTYCGVDASRYSGTWSGGWSWEESKKTLFKNVTTEVIKVCSDISHTSQRGQNTLIILEDILTKARRKIKAGERDDGFLYLGRGDKSGCIGSNENDVCARYKKRGNEEDVPWLTKMENTLRKLKNEERRRANSLFISTAIHGQRTSEEAREIVPAAVPVAHEVSTIQNEPTSDETYDRDSKDETATEITRSTGNHERETTKSRKRFTTNSSFAEIPHIATDVDDDGSLLTKPQWFILAAFIV